MFTYFHNRKLKYNKGQLAPFFIVIMVAIVIMAMVTVNLSKVALTKTESANAADSGALAAGSIMANVFNSIAKQNAQMEFQYWTFFTSVSVSFTVAVGALAVAAATACSLYGACAGDVAANIAWWTMLAIIIAVEAFNIAQNYTLQIIKEKIGVEGRKSAIKAGHQFVFINSGIGSKLKEGSQRDDFKNFMNGISHLPTYTYSWQDGQGRAHSVTSTVNIEEVDKFDMQATLLPALSILALVGTAIGLTTIAIPILHMLCLCSSIVTCPALPACGGAVAALIGSITALASAWAGISPTGAIIEDSSSGALSAIASMWIYAWIDDIDHDRKVEVRTNQHHGGTDLGLWTAQYPDTYSSSRVDFTGNGKIHPPKLRFDSSIEAVDFP
ncbi:hypothetical protein EPN54_04280 [bacterium]|nr:MAG: hypothetical protein EPN54_04280 [bacterium]